jgi:DNA helicase-2/ATP-dependent DNA helicase PcrA
MKTSTEINEAIEALTSREITELEETYQGLHYLNKLNKGQKIAATREEGNYLVIAGPGTGKTHTLVYRVLHLIKRGVDPKSIVIITFTRKAGNVIRERLGRLVPNTTLGFVGTFHAFANHISQLIGSESPISKFRLLDSEDDMAVHKLVMADFGEFNKRQSAKGLQKMLSYCCNTGLSVKEYIQKFDLRKMADDAENIQAYMRVYEKYKVDHMLANYDDMISVISRYLERAGSEEITAPFEYLMIDEYQDTNQMQLDFVQRLKIKNVMAIGDDFQGIYAFRGADHRIILNFYNDFRAPQMIKLTENYRSTDQIVGWTNQTIAR